MPPQPPPIPWLAPSQCFPPASQAWDENSPAPGLLAAGGALDVDTLRQAYSHGIFPWYSEGQPTLWWSPNPRMVLDVSKFRVHPSFRKTLEKFCRTPSCEIRMDSAFEQVIQACSTSPRDGQSGTWIVPDMIAAYGKLHGAGFAHSVETWANGKLAGGLYCVALGKAVFGESMFSYSTDASKIALAALVGFCRHHGIRQIDCQQNTRHLASLGAHEISRDVFLTQVATDLVQPGPVWKFAPLYWQELLPLKATPT
ncbi:leucyl/phenylalanyl-tRNA--protein transferase [Rhodoferax ferrireducens]|uniref:leucyl/phenylalanyl-tRNA--protein transferase n=1 Tax=Rhodoferax ferrireducens TaxID=192843 RepID=UPI000E0D2660|nr:leucyl/phenylalanyl-tRNA--protein transferase [Rhodoferax ferrireducens]